MRMAKLSALGEHRSLDAEKLGYSDTAEGVGSGTSPSGDTMGASHKTARAGSL